jgi:MinD superfamily P-loop ATPase
MNDYALLRNYQVMHEQICEACNLPKNTPPADVVRYVKESMGTIAELKRVAGLKLDQYTHLDAVARPGCHGSLAR